MESTLLKLLQEITSHPEDIKIEREDDLNSVRFTITVNEEDKGIVIGKGGRSIKALNNIISIKGLKENKKVFLKVS